MKTPPSGFALKVGAAALNKVRLLLTLVVQHWNDELSVVALAGTVNAVLLCPTPRQSTHPDH
jgi:hypothetical protein